MELEVINPEHNVHGKMLHNDSHKHESIFTSVTVQENNSVMLSSLSGSTLGVWATEKENSTYLWVKKTTTLLLNMVMKAILQI
jgi:phosphoribosylformylglycinamidine (FGAM) synthase-like amidotransferase family enzyme